MINLGALGALGALDGLDGLDGSGDGEDVDNFDNMIPGDINDLILNDDYAAAVKALECYLVDNATDDDAWYHLGLLYWKLDNRSGAVSCYKKAVAINPDSPARHALQIATDVFDYFNPDLLNP